MDCRVGCEDLSPAPGARRGRDRRGAEAQGGPGAPGAGGTGGRQRAQGRRRKRTGGAQLGSASSGVFGFSIPLRLLGYAGSRKTGKLGQAGLDVRGDSYNHTHTTLQALTRLPVRAHSKPCLSQSRFRGEGGAPGTFRSELEVRAASRSAAPSAGPKAWDRGATSLGLGGRWVPGTQPGR